MTIKLKKRTTWNRTEPIPSRRATQVLSAQTDAAWELGMPPVSTRRRTLIFFSRTRKVNTLLSCTRSPHRRAWTRGLEEIGTLVGPVEEELGHRDELLGAAPELGGDRGGFAEEPGSLALGALRADASGGGGLSPGLVRAGRLPQRLPRGA